MPKVQEEFDALLSSAEAEIGKAGAQEAWQSGMCLLPHDAVEEISRTMK
jgi:hypothetical protein